MWFLNKLGAVFSTENRIFHITYPDYIFIKNWKNAYAVKKKINQEIAHDWKSLVMVMLQLHKGAFMFQKLKGVAQNWEHWHALPLLFRRVCSAARNHDSHNNEFHLLKKITFWKASWRQLSKYRVQTKGNYVINTSPIVIITGKITKNVWAHKGRVYFTGENNTKMSMGKIKSIIIIIIMR